ncbi:uncharacterized protein LODBEIA_P10820 [Lodderomyces beijingensis]|uniref:GATA-type domain-containing protein n=1 Tax=Lodderomyces beijingensis TaxID=1775926 RepID=A0ABP0ZGY0_9ASCO
MAMSSGQQQQQQGSSSNSNVKIEPVYTRHFAAATTSNTAFATSSKPELKESTRTPSFSSPNYQTSSGNVVISSAHALPTPPSKPTSKKPTTKDPSHPNESANPNPKPSSSSSTSSASASSLSSPICRNCQTQTTPLWRRDETGQVLCNACGLFLKLHGRARPISLKTDTIKSRNRVKQGGGGSSSSSGGSSNAGGSGGHNSGASNKSSGTSTPELKSKDLKNSNANGNGNKKSPKVKKFKNSTTSSNDLTPLLPATVANTPSTLKTTTTESTPINHQHIIHPQLPNHVLQAHQVPLHYPSSTPTQFAPGLRRITSPLLLSSNSASAVRNEPISDNMTSLQAAAGVLENLSNELGPSASFKNGVSKTTGISLMSKTESSSGLSSSSSSSIFSSITPSTLPRLSALNKKSPAFSEVHSRCSTPTLPPLHEMAKGEQSLSGYANQSQKPSFEQSSRSSNDATSGENGSSINNNNNNKNVNFQNPGSGEHSDNNNSNNNNNNNNSNNNNNNTQYGFYSSHEITILKTRISELELVNDLYRTRIMELEAMEQAARLRENSMKKRLEEVMNLQASTLLQHQQNGRSNYHENEGPRLSPSFTPSHSGNDSSSFAVPKAPASHHQHQHQHQQQNEIVVLPPLKRDHDNTYPGNDKKPKYN